MSVDFRQLTVELRVLINRLKQRCLEAEARNDDMERKITSLQERVAQLEEENNTLRTKYSDLQTGIAAASQTGDASQTDHLKEQYLAMVSEIDACIAMLQHG